MTVFSTTRRLVLSAIAGVMLAACGSADGSPTTGKPASVLGVKSLGEADAPLVLQEYASVTCSHCKHFHDDVMSMVKAEYIASGLLRFEFHDFPTPPADLAVSGFAVARCAGEGNYYKVLDDLFANQEGLFRAYQGGQAVAALRVLAERHGLDKAAFDACLTNKDVLRTISDITLAGEARGVRSTPTIFLNGELISTPESRTAEGMKALLDAKLTKLGVAR